MLTTKGKDFLKSTIFIETNKEDFYISTVKKCMDDIISRMKHDSFKQLEDININNLRQFWLEALKEYQDKTLTQTDVLNIIDSFEDYTNRRFGEDYPEFEWLNFPDSDPRSIGLNATQYIKDAAWFGNLESEFVIAIQNYLKTLPGQELKANHVMDQLSQKLEMIWREKATDNPKGKNIVLWNELQLE